MQQGNDYLAENRGIIMKGISKIWTKRTLAAAVLSAGLIISQGAAASIIYSADTTTAGINDATTDFMFGGLNWAVNIQWTGNPDPTPANVIADDTTGDTNAESVTLNGSNTDSGAISYVAITTTLAEAGTILFDWAYSTTDAAGGDLFYGVNGAYDAASSLYGFSTNADGSDAYGIALLADDIFTLAISSDNLGGCNADFTICGLSGFGTAVISGLGFTASNFAVPVPPAFLLFGTALAGLGLFRKKRAIVAA